MNGMMHIINNQSDECIMNGKLIVVLAGVSYEKLKMARLMTGLQNTFRVS